MPHEYIIDSVFLTVSSENTRSPVVGHTPPLASVAPIVAMLRAVTSIEHAEK